MRTIQRYLAPGTLAEAARILAEGDATILAGATDLMPRWRKGVSAPPATLVDLKRIGDLRGIRRVNGEICIGACTSFSDLTTDPTIRTAAPVLAEAASRAACCQIRNRATIGGNLCNASPAADTAVPLILLDAAVDLVSFGKGGITARHVPIDALFCGPGVTVRAPVEILTQVRFTPPREGSFAAWDKFGTRPAMEIAVASVGVALEITNGMVSRARVGYGSVAPVPLRGRRAEAHLLGQPLCTDTIDQVVTAAQTEISPITDVRASESHRRRIVNVLLRRLLTRAAEDRPG